MTIEYEIDPWPLPKPGQKKGPTEMQKRIFFWHIPPEKREHNHTLDIVLLIGGAGSGKSVACVAAVTELVASTKSIKSVVGGANYPLLKRNVISEFGKRFGKEAGEWNHPLVKKRPTQNEQFMKVIPPLAGTLQFLNLDKYLVARGFDADHVFIEEINLMDAESFDEMIRRSRGRALPIRQFLLTCNPSGERDWLYDKFNLQQFEEDYSGPPIPIGEPCKCQFCHYCLDRGFGQFEWLGGERKFKEDGSCYNWSNGTCPNDLNHTNNTGDHIQVIKESGCPGNQQFYRVILSASYDNPHNPSDYVQNMRSVLDPDAFDVFVLGKIKLLRKGKVYSNFSSQNVFQKSMPLNWEKPIYWAHDFNINPMCSVICQETEWGLHVVDEIVKWDANEEKVAQEFVKRFQGFDQEVIIYGDPAGIYGNSAKETKRTSYQILYDYLKLHKFNVSVGTQRIKGETKIYIRDRVNNVRAMLKNAKGEVRLKINQTECPHLIQSLAAITWNEQGTEEDKKADDRAKENPRREQLAPIMTHPSCALGYFITKRFPIIMRKQAQAVFETGERSLEIDLETAQPKINKEREVEIEDYSLVQTGIPFKESEVSLFTPIPVSTIIEQMGSPLMKQVLKERLEKEEKEKEEQSKILQQKLEKFVN